jgi:ketosteroid isomerase-like protein
MNKKLWLLLMVGTVQWMAAQEKEVKETVVAFFGAFHARDIAGLHRVCSANMVLHSINESAKGGIFSQENPEDFYKSIAGLPDNLKFEEKILSYKIQADGNMAQVWAPYEFYADGKLSHKGVDAFTLFNDNGSWKIIYLVDTRRR